MSKDIKLVSPLVAGSEGQEFIRRFHENNLHLAVKEYGGEVDREECYYY